MPLKKLNTDKIQVNRIEVDEEAEERKIKERQASKNQHSVKKRIKTKIEQQPDTTFNIGPVDK